MTLNVTVLSDTLVVQVSDRRLVDAFTGTMVDDGANKAVVLASAQAMLAMTFAGIGQAAETRVDHWLADGLHEAGMAELPAERTPQFIAEAATEWFRTFPPTVNKSHVFSVAGWSWDEPGQPPRPVFWLVTNQKEGKSTETPQAGESFEVIAPRRRGAYMTGALPAVTRASRRRLTAIMRAARTLEDVENTAVSAVREAASQPGWSWAIGRNCMAVSISNRRQAIATYYPDGSAPEAFGPQLILYAGGRRLVIRDPVVAPFAGRLLGFGGDPPLLVLRVRGIPAGKPGISNVRLDVKFDNAKHRTSDEIEDINLVQLL